MSGLGPQIDSFRQARNLSRGLPILPALNTPSIESVRLRALAERYAQGLRIRGFGAIAVMGSVARGDALPGAAIDVWVIGRHDARANDRIDEVPVRVLFQPMEMATSREQLARVDGGRLIVLADDGRFTQVQRTWAKERASLVQAHVDETITEVGRNLAAAESGSTAAQLLYLRDTALRLVSLETALGCDVRAPKFRHVIAHYSDSEVHQVRRLLGLLLCDGHEEDILAGRAAFYQEHFGQGTTITQALALATPEALAQWRLLEHIDASATDVWALRQLLAAWLVARALPLPWLARRRLKQLTQRASSPVAVSPLG